jgi:two-component system, NarL family, nitrate/nitrite response regulator NarL
VNNAIRVFVVAEVRLYRDGLSDVIARNGRFEVVGSSRDVSTAIASVGVRPPDVVLVSTGLPANLEWIRRLADTLPDAAVVALAVPEIAEDVITWVEAGASAFLTTDASLNDLLATIEDAHRQEAHCSPRMLAALLKRLRTPRSAPPEAKAVNLTMRERQIGGLLASGMSNKEIASQLQIEVTTVKNHVHNILEKLGVKGRSEVAVMFAQTGPRSRSTGRQDLDLHVQ